MSSYLLSLYEKAMPPHLGWAEKLAAAGEAGFDAVEISIDETDEKLERLDNIFQATGEIISAIRCTNVPVYTMCLSGHRKYPLGSSNPDIARRSLDIMEKAIDFAASAGIRIIQLAGYDVYYEPSTETTRRNFAQNLRRCVEMASRKGVVLGFETMENDFMNTVTKAMRYVKEIGSPYLQVFPDVGNICNAVPDAVADIQNGKGHIVAAHLKETKPGVFRNLYFGEGQVDFPSLIGELKRLGVRMFTAEFWYSPDRDWKRELRRASAFFRPYLR